MMAAALSILTSIYLHFNWIVTVLSMSSGYIIHISLLFSAGRYGGNII